MRLQSRIAAGVAAGLAAGALSGAAAAALVAWGVGVLRPANAPLWCATAYLVFSLALIGAATGCAAALAGMVIARRSEPFAWAVATQLVLWVAAPLLLWANIAWLPGYADRRSIAANLAVAAALALVCRMLATALAPVALALTPSRRRQMFAAIVAIVALAGIGVGVRPAAVQLPASPPSAASPRSAASAETPNIIFVSIDALRADHLGAYGYTRPTSPRIDALAAKGLRFERCEAAAPNTHPAMAGIMASTLLVDFDFLATAGFLPASRFTLAQALKLAGYATAGVVANPALGSVVGFDHGFEIWDDTTAVMLRPAQVSAAALAAADRARGPGARPLFLWVHYLDPHHPYTPTGAYADLFPSTGKAGEVRASLGHGTSFEARLRLTAARPDPWGEGFAAFVDLYDGEIRETDAAVGELLDGLAARGLLEGAIVVLTADHGEEFLDHGGVLHGHSVYEELTRVPLILVAPSLAAGATVSTPVRAMDIAPTITAFAGIEPEPSWRWQGRDLMSQVEGREGPRLTLSEKLHPTEPAVPPMVALSDGRFKLITPTWRPYLAGAQPWRFFQSWRGFVMYLGAGRPRLYDLGEPGERTDLARSQPAKIAELERELDAVYRSGAPQHSQATLDDETRERLKSLGYINP